MTGRASVFQILLVLALAVVAAGTGYWLTARQPPGAEPQGAVSTASGPAATAIPPPPFRIKGTLLGAPGRAALIAVLEPDGAERPTVKVTEGETLEHYRLERIDTYRVYFTREGARFMLVVGADRPSEPPVIPADAIPPDQQREPRVQISAPPPGVNIEQERRNMQQLVDQMRQSPKLQQEKQRRIREMEERRRAGETDAPAASPP